MKNIPLSSDRSRPTLHRVTAPRGLACVALGLALLTACGSDSASGDGTTASSDGTSCSSTSSFPATPLTTVTSDSGKLRVGVFSAPFQPLIAGIECIELVVTDPSTGAGMDDLTVSMTPWMTAMGHGASVTPTVAPLGQGRYVFSDVSLFMPGEWQLRTKLTGSALGEAGDSVEPTFSVD